jgi:hypothetical protein
MFSRLFVPDTWDFMYAGYIVLTIVLGIYVASIAARWRKGKQEYRDLVDN